MVANGKADVLWILWLSVEIQKFIFQYFSRKRWCTSSTSLVRRLESILDPHADEVLEVLSEIVGEAYEFIRENDLSATLQNFSGNSSSKKHLPEAIVKLARHYSAASEFVCAASRPKGIVCFRLLR